MLPVHNLDMDWMQAVYAAIEKGSYDMQLANCIFQIFFLHFENTLNFKLYLEQFALQ